MRKTKKRVRFAKKLTKIHYIRKSYYKRGGYKTRRKKRRNKKKSAAAEEDRARAVARGDVSAPSSDDEAGVHIPTLGEASPSQPARTRRTLADSHDSASVDDIPEIDTLDAVSASPQYSSRLGRQASVVEGDDGDSLLHRTGGSPRRAQ